MKVLLIGWDSADWKVINPLMDQGEMPNLEKLVNEGVSGSLATMYPELSPMLWTSIATGKRPFKHGILGFSEPTLSGDSIRPITNISRKTRAIWNILNLKGKKSNVVGWWPSHPAEPINGVMVSNRYQRANQPLDKPWPILSGTVHPERLAENLASIRLHPQELKTEHIAPFIQSLENINQNKDKRLENIAKILCDCININSAATALMQLEKWDFMGVYFDSIDHFSHGFMQYHPPKLNWIPQKDFDIYHDVVNSGYRFHDMMLGTLLDLAGDDTTVIIVSDHGFHSDHLRPRSIPSEPAGPAVQHRHYGMITVKGPGIKKDERIYGASLLDITPTILTIFDEPVGEDMDGKPLVNIFEEKKELSSIPSWDDVDGDAGTLPADQIIDSREAAESIQQLVELGYIEKPDENIEKAVSQTVRELDYNLAQSYNDANLYYNSIPIFEKLFKKWPDEFRFGIQLVGSLRVTGQTVKARKVLEDMFEHKKVVAAKAQKELADLNKKLKEEEEKEKEYDISEKDRRKLKKLRAAATTNRYTIEYLMGSILFSEGKNEEAIEKYKKAKKINSSNPGIFTALGEVYLKTKKFKDAEMNYKKALNINPENSVVHIGLANVYLGLRWNYDAVDEALKSIGLLFFNPMAHYTLGTALHRIGKIPRAIEALKLALVQSPNQLKACNRLVRIYENRMKDQDEADKYKKMSKEISSRLKNMKLGKTMPSLELKVKARTAVTSDINVLNDDVIFEKFIPGNLPETITVVSGLPRSGTSMLMQMLEAGGIEPLTDGERVANEDNPKGYYEYTAVKNIKKDARWLDLAKGKSVKIIVQLLNFAIKNKKYNYRVIFIERDIQEILESQTKMLEHSSGYKSPLSNEQLANVYNRQLNALKRVLAAHKIPVLFINYKSCIENPGNTAEKINKFMGGMLNENAMAASVDSKLYRCKSKP